MMSVIVFMGVGLAYSLIFFFIFEAGSLRKHALSFPTPVATEEHTFTEHMKHYHVYEYMRYYFSVIFIFSIFIVNLSYIPNEFGLREILPYLFITPLWGSLFILFFKWKKALRIKIFSSLMFTFIFLFASISAFSLSYFIHS